MKPRAKVLKELVRLLAWAGLGLGVFLLFSRNPLSGILLIAGSAFVITNLTNE